MVTRYLVNPDVSCREEGQDGALLFNPDNAQSSVINTIGLLIWQYLHNAHTDDEIITYLLEVCDDVPTDQVTHDVTEFIQSLRPDDFVQEVPHNAN